MEEHKVHQQKEVGIGEGVGGGGNSGHDTTKQSN